MKVLLKQKITIEDIFIFLVAVYLFLETISNGTGFSNDILASIHSINQIIWNIFRVFVLIKIIVQFEKSDYKIIVLLALAFLSSYYTSSYWMSTIIWILAGTKYVDLKSVIRAIYYAKFCAVALVIVLCFSGTVDNTIITEQGERVRQSMGFNHPNALAAEVFQLEAMYIYLHDKRISKLNVVMLIMISIMTYVLSRSQTVAVLSIFMLFFFFLLSGIYRAKRKKTRNIWVKIYEAIFNRMKYISIVTPLVATVIILYLSQREGQGTLYSRAHQAFIYLQYYGISLWGQPLQINNGGDNFYLQNSQLYTLDNSYLYLLIGFGIIFFLLFVFAQIVLIYSVIKQKEYTTATILILYMIYGIVETMMIRFTYNFSILFMALLIWKCSMKVGYKTNENIIYSTRRPIKRR